MAHFYPCPSCGKRRLDVEFSNDTQSDEIFCSGCGFKKVVSRVEFVREIHDRDPRTKKTRQAVIKKFASKGIAVTVERARLRKPTVVGTSVKTVQR